MADPLDPPLSWQEKLFCRIDPQSEAPLWIRVEDCKVDNVEKSRGGGLTAHTSWDNEEQVVQLLADPVSQTPC